MPKAEYDQIVALFNAGSYSELEILARRLIDQHPDAGFLWMALGVSLQVQRKAALPALRKAAELSPDAADAHYNLANTLREIGQPHQAVVSYQRALEIKPDFAEAHCNLGNALKDLSQFDNAQASYRRALQIDPAYAQAHSNLLFTMNYTADNDASSHVDEAREYGRRAAARVGTRFSSWKCAARPERLRVGLISGDLRNHAVGHFLESTQAHIDPQQIELIGYPCGPMEDDLTVRLRRYFSG